MGINRYHRPHQQTLPSEHLQHTHSNQCPTRCKEAITNLVMPQFTNSHHSSFLKWAIITSRFQEECHNLHLNISIQIPFHVKFRSNWLMDPRRRRCKERWKQGQMAKALDSQKVAQQDLLELLFFSVYYLFFLLPILFEI